MKKIISLILVSAIVFANTTLAFAGPTEAVSIMITINHGPSVKLENAGNLNLTLNPGETKSGGSMTVTNDGTGISETISLANVKIDNQATLPTGFALQFQFTAVDAKPADNDANWKSYNETIQVDAAHNESRYLWIKLTIPNPTDKTALAITMDVTAA